MPTNQNPHLAEFQPPVWTLADLPTPDPKARGRLATVADDVRGTWRDGGSAWYPFGDSANVMDFGARGDGSSDDSAAIQAALTEAAGGELYFPAGTYLCENLSISSQTTLRGNAGAVLKKITPTTGNLLDLKTRSTTGTIATGFATLTVASASGMYIGQAIAVEMADVGAPNQNTPLNGAIDSVVLSLVLTSASGFPDPNGSIGYYLRIDSEVLGFTDLSGTTATVTRGALGTTAASHSNGATVYFQSVLMTQIKDISGTTITLQEVANLGVTNTLVLFGAYNVKILNLELDGNRQAADVAAPSASGIGTSGYVSDLVVRNCRIRNFQRQGIVLTAPWNCQILDNFLYNCGQRGAGTEQGAHIFLIGQPRRNLISRNRILADNGLQGITVDDRSSGGSRVDGEGLNNEISDNIMLSYGALGATIHNGIVVQGCSQTLVHHNTVVNFLNGILLSGAQGNPTSLYPDDCVVDGNLVRNCTNGIVASDTPATNVIVGNIIEGGTTPLNVGKNPQNDNYVDGVCANGFLATSTRQGTYIVRQVVAKEGIADNVATEVFKIVTAVEGSADGGGYRCTVDALLTHGTGSASGTLAAKSYHGEFARAMMNTGVGASTAVENVATFTSVSTTAASRDIGTVTMSTAENTEYDTRVSFQIDLTGSAITTARIVCYILIEYYDFLSAPVVTGL